MSKHHLLFIEPECLLLLLSVFILISLFCYCFMFAVHMSSHPILLLAAINVKIELDVHTGNDTYLRHIRSKLPQALDEFQPDIVVYNAGK